MTPTEQGKRERALDQDANLTRRTLCAMVVHREADMEDVKQLAKEMLLSLEWATDFDVADARKLVEYKKRARQMGVIR